MHLYQNCRQHQAGKKPDTDRPQLDDWTDENCIKFNNDKFKALHLTDQSQAAAQARV